MKKNIKKIIAGATLFFFLVSGQGASSASVEFAVASLHGQGHIRAEDAVIVPGSVLARGLGARQIARAPIVLPASLGSIEEFQPATSVSKLPTILHLQTAHGDDGAQMALVRVLNFLKKNQGFDLLLLEGADDKLEPELDRFFKNNTWNQEVARERVKKGRMSGAAYFLMRQPEGSVKAMGVESAEAYRNNRRDFLTLIQERSSLESFLKKTELDLDRLFSKKATKSILDLRRQERAFQQERLDWANWIGVLKKAARADLNLDLEHLSSQKDWPSLLRFLWLSKKTQAVIKPELPVADEGLSTAVSEILNKAHDGGDFHYGEARLILEEWLSSKNKIENQLSTEQTAVLTRMVLQNEIRPEELWRETQALTRQIMAVYAKTPIQKKLLQLDEDLKLLRGLLLTELSFPEYQRAQRRGKELRPSRFIERVQAVSSLRAPPLRGEAISEIVTPSVRAREDEGSIDKSFDTALAFYSGAKVREKKMASNVAALLKQNFADPKDHLRKDNEPSGFVVLVTGGFHAEGLRDEFAGRGVSYMRVTPRTLRNNDSFSAVVSQDPRAVYRQVFLEHSRRPEKSAQIEDAAVLPLPMTDLNRLGVSHRGFIRNRTEVLTDWFLAMGGRVNRKGVVQEFNESPFADEYDLWAEWTGPKLIFSRSEMRAQKDAADGHKQIQRELRSIDEALYHQPQGEVPEFSKIQVLLAALYGGAVQLHVEQAKVATKIKSSQKHLEKRSYHFRWGLYALADKTLSKQLPASQRRKIQADIRKTVQELAQMGIRVDQVMSSSVTGGEMSVGAILTHSPAFQNPFLHTFLGDSKQLNFAVSAQSRLERAVDILTTYPAVKGRKITPAEVAYLRSFDNIFIPDFKMGESTPFIVRVQHNRARGPYKGGIRLVNEFTLVHDKHFKHLFDDLKASLTLQELRYFLRKYVLEETLPLSFGMTSKAAVVNLPYGGGKGTLLVADVVETDGGDKIIEDFHKDQADVESYLFQLARGAARVLAESGTIRSDNDIPAADLNSGSYMDVMADEQIRLVYEAIQPKLQALLTRRAGQLASDDKDFIEALAQVPPLTLESLESPLYLQEVTKYGDRLRRAKRKVSSWAMPLFEAAAAYTSKERWMGSAFRNESTGAGGIHVLREVVLREGLSLNEDHPLKGMTAKLMGLGKVGAPAAEKMIAEGMTLKLIALGPLGAVAKDEGGFTYEEIALIRKMLAQKINLSQLGQVGYEAPGLEYIEPAQVDARLLELDVDVFVLAAVENAIHVGNVSQARGRFFLELANGAITNEAYDRITQDPNTMVIPDTLANAGGVTVSYYEWLQNLSNERWTREDVISRLEQQLSRGVERVAQVRETYKTDWRTAADVLMITEVLDARRAKKRAKSVRSKTTRSEVRADTDVSALASNFQTGRSEVRADTDVSALVGNHRTGRSEVRADTDVSALVGNHRTGRSEVRAKKDGGATLLTAEDVRKELEALREASEMSDLGGSERHAFMESLQQADQAIQGDSKNLPLVMRSVATSLRQAAAGIQSYHTKTINALHQRTSRFAKSLWMAYAEKPEEKKRGDTGNKSSRSEIRAEVRYVLPPESQGARYTAIRNSQREVQDEAILRTAEFFDGLFLPEDLQRWGADPNTPAWVLRYLEVPSFHGDLDSVLAQVTDLFADAKLSSGEWMREFLGDTFEEREKKAYIIGPEMVRRYGPVLIALEQAVSSAARLIVLAKNDSDVRELEKLVWPINSHLPKSRRLMIKTPEQARILLKADTVRGLGLGEVDAALLRRLIPDFLPLNVSELDAWVSQVPGLTALVTKFRALSVLATAA